MGGKQHTRSQPVAVLPARPVLRRSCSCGQHRTGGGECDSCRGGRDERVPVLIRPKLAVSRPADPEEQEADRVADEVLSGPSRVAVRADAGLPVLRDADGGQEEKDEEDEEEPVSRSAGPGHAPEVSPGAQAALDAARAGGTPMSAADRRFFEARFGRDLTSVRLHTDPAAGRLATGLHAHAFTRGQHIFFAPGRYRPDTVDGRRLLAHELTHTVQDHDVTSVADTVRRQAAAAPALAEPSTDPAAPPSPAAAPPLPTPAPAPAPAPGPESQLPAAAGDASAQAAGGPAAAGAEAPVEAGAEGAATAIDTSTGAGVLQSLANVPVSSFGQSVTAAGQGVQELQERERGELAQSLPVIDRPTGLPARSGPIDAPPTEVAKGEVPEPSTPAAAGAAPADTTHQPASGPLPAERVEARVQEPEDDGGGGWWDWLSGALRRFLARIPTSDPSLDTSAGPRRRVDKTGDADPAENDKRQRAAAGEVKARRAEADAATGADFGEKDIYPNAADGTLRPAGEPGAPPEGGGPVRDASVPDVVRSGMDQAGAGWLRGQVQERVTQEQTDRTEYEEQSRDAHDESDREIAEATKKARDEQIAARGGAADEVAAQRAQWRADNLKIEEKYGKDAGAERTKTDEKIDTEVRTTEARSDAELSGAERKAEQKKLETERKAEEKKKEAEKRPSGFWARARGAVSDFFDKIKDAVNALFDELRSFVKGLIERAKQLVSAWIEAARRALVAAIRIFGEVLKGIASIALAAFPGLAERVRDWIDDRVDDAVEVVNKAAEVLQQAAQRALDKLGAALDAALAWYQRALTTMIDGLKFLAVGILEIMERIGYLVEAARQMPDHFLGQASEELLGQDLTAPLPFERTASATPAKDTAVKAAVQSGAVTPADAQALTRTTASDTDVAVDQVVPLDLDPELLSSLALTDGEEREFGENSDPSRTLAAIQSEQAGGGEAAGPGALPAEPAVDEEPAGPEPAGPEAAGPGVAGPEAAAETPEQETERRLAEMMASQPEPACPKETSSNKADESAVPEEMKFGPLTVGQRARYLLDQMIKGIKNWFSCNWPWLLAAAIGVLTVAIAAMILTGGAILAAVPPIMQIVGAVLLGVAAVQVAGHVGDYLAKGWAGEIVGAARSLARGLAMGAIELVFTLLFDLNAVLKAARQGLRATVRGALATAKATGRQFVAAGRQVVHRTAQNLRRVGRAAATVGRASVRGGKVVMQGLRRGWSQGVRTLDDLARRLWGKVRFRRFKLVRRGSRIQLWGYINPWLLMADGEVVWSDVTEAGAQVGGKRKHDGRRAFVVGVSEEPDSAFVKKLKTDEAAAKSFYRQFRKLQKDDIRKIIFNRESTARLRVGIPKPRPDYFQAHHVVPRELRGDERLRDFLEKIDFNWENGAENGIMLPPNKELALLHPAWENASLHYTSHRNYTRRVQNSLNRLVDEYGKAVARGKKEPAKAKLKEILDDLKMRLMNGDEPLD